MDAVREAVWRDTAIDAFAAGFYAFVALYHLQLFRRRPEERAYLAVALVCVGALQVDLTGIWGRFSAGSPLLELANVGGAAVAVGALLEYCAALFEGGAGPRTRLAQAGLGVATVVGVWVAPPLAPASWLLGLAGSVAMAGRALARGDAEARTIAGGFAVFASVLAADIVLGAASIPRPLGLPVVAFAAFVLALAVSLSDRFERTHRELDALRRDLEARVADRTRALDGANRRLRRYFPRPTVDRILSSDEDARPSTERRVVTVLFADLAGFTAWSEGRDPQLVTAMLNAYLTAMVAEIEREGGALDKVMGDGLMALFGAPVADAADTQAARAVRAARAMSRRLSALVAEWAADGVVAPFQVRIGVHQDEVAVGNVGTPELWSYTAVGSGVNLAARLEGACPPGRVLASTAVRAHLAELPWEGPTLRPLKGFREPVETWTLAP